jgi:CheY-like chemotaxis protein
MGLAAERCVLVVDDDQAILEAVASILEDQGYDVLVAFGGEHAWMTLQVHPTPPDMLLVDLMMPRGDGWSLMERLQTDARLVDIPVVVMSAGGYPLLASAPGAAGYLAKPIKLKALLETLEQAMLLQPGGRSQAHRTRVGSA